MLGGIQNPVWIFLDWQSAELKARLQQAQALADQREYNRMVQNVDPNVS